MALTTNPLFSKENLKKATSSLGMATYTLLYDNNDLPEQIKAGKELVQAKWILATICWHVFDYYPLEYFLPDEQRNDYIEYLKWFMDHMSVGLRNALEYVNTDYATLETITRDELNQHRIPIRKPDEEANVRAIFEVLVENSDELFVLLSGPKKVADPEKPSAEMIKSLMKRITDIQEMVRKNDSVDNVEALQFCQNLEYFKNPLRQAWQVYHYGWHSDFWEEGESMFDYMMYEVNAKEFLEKLIQALDETQVFNMFPGGSSITHDLLQVYRHLIKQNLNQ